MQVDSTPTLEQRLRSVSKDLCGALMLALSEAVQHRGNADTLRPVQLTGELGLNKSLASRVVRSLRDRDELRALLGIPTPQGLQLVERAALKKGISPAAHEALTRATETYRSLLGEFSGGRTDLEATLAGWIPEQRARAERDARRSVFRGMTTLAGTRAGAVYNAIYLLPSATDIARLDSMAIAVRQDVRRLRADEEILVMSITADEDSQVDASHRTTLDGAPIEGDPRSLVLPDLCSHPQPSLGLEASPSRLAVKIAKEALDINEMSTLGFGWRTREHFERYASGDLSHGNISFAASNPTECLVVDLFVHREVELSGDPFATLKSDLRLDQGGQHTPPEKGTRQRQDAPKVISLDHDPSGLASPDIRSCKAIAENVCREASVNVKDFRAYRVRLEFPMATEQLTLWWALAAR